MLRWSLWWPHPTLQALQGSLQITLDCWHLLVLSDGAALVLVLPLEHSWPSEGDRQEALRRGDRTPRHWEMACSISASSRPMLRTIASVVSRGVGLGGVCMDSTVAGSINQSGSACAPGHARPRCSSARPQTPPDHRLRIELVFPRRASP